MDADTPNSNLHLPYYVFGDACSDTDFVEIPRSVWIRDLVEAIKKSYLSTMDATLPGMDLFKVKLTIDELDGLQRPDTKHALNKHLPVASVWPADSELDPLLIHIVVVPTCPARRRATPQESSQASLSGIESVLRDLNIAREQTLKTVVNGQTASYIAQPSAFKRQQSQSNAPIMNGRPYKNTASPVQIYHEAFCIFEKEVHGTDAIAALDYRAVGGFLLHAQRMYDHEDERLKQLKDFLAVFLGFDIAVEKVSKCEADGVIKAYEPHSGKDAFCAILEVENEIGGANCDPAIQGVESYAHYWFGEEMAALRDVSCCPSFIIAMAGPWMCILGAVLLDRVVVQPLTELLWLANHPQQEDRLKHLTRVFCALRMGLEHLHRYYQTLGSSTDLKPKHTPFFPYISQFRDSEGSLVKFAYMLPLVTGSTRSVFKAQTDQGVEIVVKFVQRYNVEAHRMLANLDLAPKLLCDESLGVGLRMIVMEYVPGEDLHTHLSGLSNGSQVSDSIRADVEKALEVLHDSNFVFGDLRPPNVMVVEKESGQMGAMLIDFDWCGQHDITRYPINMNPEIRWPIGVDGAAPMLQEHDRTMLKFLFDY